MASEAWAAVRSWAAGALGGNVQAVIRADQDAPRPQRPFVTVKIASEATVGDAHVSEVDDYGLITIGQDTELTASVQVFGGAAFDLAQTLQRSLDRVTVQEAFRAAGLAYVDILSPVTDIAALTGTTMEPRAGFDARFRTATQLIDDVGIIETVIGTGTVNGAEVPFEISIE